MVDGTPSRRSLLRAIGAAGGLSLMGVGTYALQQDRDTYGSHLQAGDVDLELAWQAGDETYPPGQETFPSAFANSDGISFDVPQLIPGATTRVRFAFRSCGNPSHVWLSLHHDDAPLTDLVQMRLILDPDCGGTFDGKLLAEGTVADVVAQFASPRPFLAPCQHVGKLEYEGGEFVLSDDTAGTKLTYEGDPAFRFAASGTLVRLSDVTHKDGEDDEPIAVDLEVVEGPLLCRAEVAGGSGSNAYTFECAETVTDLSAPLNDGGQQAAISNLVLAVCDDAGCLPCEPRCLGVEWTLPEGVTVPEDRSFSVTFDVDAQQCRHNDDPTPP